MAANSGPIPFNCVSIGIQAHYQPLMKLAENRLVGFEILARWHHPARGDVEPDTFIPVVEKLGLIGKLTFSLLRHACLDARNWPPEITIALNVSPKHFADPLLPVKLLAILSETGFSPSRLEIEVTESALEGDLPAARANFVALQNIGIKISLDDFGSGHSSPCQRRPLPPISPRHLCQSADWNSRAEVSHNRATSLVW